MNVAMMGVWEANACLFVAARYRVSLIGMIVSHPLFCEYLLLYTSLLYFVTIA